MLNMMFEKYIVLRIRIPYWYCCEMEKVYRILEIGNGGVKLVYIRDNVIDICTDHFICDVG